MRRASTFAAIAGLLLGATPLAAEEDRPARIDPAEARQCALWASYLASEMVDDPDTQQALLFATNYFVGNYEGATGLSIAEGDDLSAATQMIGNLDAVTAMCTAHMLVYGERMQAWGEALQAMGRANS